jgi:hypothetical protein
MSKDILSRAELANNDAFGPIATFAETTPFGKDWK